MTTSDLDRLRKAIEDAADHIAQAEREGCVTRWSHRLTPDEVEALLGVERKIPKEST